MTFHLTLKTSDQNGFNYHNMWVDHICIARSASIKSLCLLRYHEIGEMKTLC